MNKGLFALLMLASGMTHGAEPYVGVRIQRVQQEPNTVGRVGDHYDVDDTRTSLGIYGGLSFRAFDVEAGGGPLGGRKSRNTSSSFDITQDIKTDHLYVAVLPRWRVAAYSAHAIIGFSRVRMSNHEYGRNENGPNQEHRNTSADTRPLLGLGAQYDRAQFALRVEAFRINNVAASPWTFSSDVKAVALGVHYGF